MVWTQESYQFNYCYIVFFRALTFDTWKWHFIPLTNWVRGPYCKIMDQVFFLLIYGPSAKRTGYKSMGKNKDP